jgi:3-oxoadipate enol-lactonase
MPHINLNGANIYYEESGAGDETIVFAHGLLWSGEMFAAQVAALRDSYRCITFDFRGQGRSEVTADGYDMDNLTADALGLIQALDCAPCHFVGLSMGGFIGQRLAIRHPQMLKSLILMETSADPEPQENIGSYRLLGFVARWISLSAIAGRVMPIMFGQKFLHDPNRATERAEWRRRMVANHRIGITRALTGVIEREGVYEQLMRVIAPTLILVGDQDVATVPAKAERIHSQIADSQLIRIPGAGHTSSVEEPAFVNQAIRAFLDSQKKA